MLLRISTILALKGCIRPEKPVVEGSMTRDPAADLMLPLRGAKPIRSRNEPHTDRPWQAADLIAIQT